MALPWPDNPYGFSSIPGLAQCSYNVALEMGFSAVRIIHDFLAIDTSGNSDPGTWSWGTMDADVQNAYANKLNYTFVLSNVGSWGQYIAPGSACGSPTISPVYALFVVQTVLNRYNSASPLVANAKIARVELANEGFDDNGFGSPCDSFEDFVLILQACYPWIKANYPDVLVGTAAHFNRQPTDVVSVQRSLYTGRNGSAAGYFDYSNYHWYGTVNITGTMGGYTGPDGPQDNGKDGFNQEWQDIRSVDAVYNPDVPIYCTETGISVPGASGVNTETDRTAYYVGGEGATGVYQDGLNSGGVLTHIFIWTIQNSNGYSISQGCSSQTLKDAANHIKIFVQTYPQWVQQSPPPPTSPYAQTILGDSPQAYYRLDETGGTIAFDATTHHNDATVSGATLSQPGALVGDTDTAMAFTAAGGLTLPISLVPSSWSAATLEFWVNVDGNWHYVVQAIDATSTILYLDSNMTTSGTGGPIFLGTNLDVAGSFTRSGLLDEVALYEYKLSAAQVLAHYTAGGGVPPPPPPPPPPLLAITLGKGLLAQERFGDQRSTPNRPLYAALAVQYTLSASQFGVPLAISYTVEKANVTPMLIYYLITPASEFAINGDGSIISPDQVIYTPRPVAARTLIAGPLLQGYGQVTWIYSTIQRPEFNHLLSFYDPMHPTVLITYPDQNGIWVQRQAHMLPPTYGTQDTMLISGVSLTFTGLAS